MHIVWWVLTAVFALFSLLFFIGMFKPDIFNKDLKEVQKPWTRKQASLTFVVFLASSLIFGSLATHNGSEKTVVNKTSAATVSKPLSKAELANQANEEKQKAETQKKADNLAKLKSSIVNEIGDNSSRGGKKITALTIDASDNINLVFKGEDNLTNKMIVEGVQLDITNALKGIKESNVYYIQADISVTFSMKDQYGNASEDQVVDLLFNKSTVDKINFDGFDFKNIYSIADKVNYIQPSFAD